jgi:hypothetical protein
MGVFAGSVIAMMAAGLSTQTRPSEVSDRLVLLGRSPAFHALIDGHDAVLELDTGSFELRLSPDFVYKNGIDRNGVKLQIGSQPEAMVKPIVEALGEPDQPNLADRYALKADGIAGLDVLRKYAIGVDLIGRKIAFWPGGKVGADFAKSWTSLGSASPLYRLDLTTRSPEDWFRVQTKVNAHPLDFIFDTGTAISSVNPSLVPKLNLRKIADTEVEEIGKTEVLPVTAADSLTFGPLAAAFPILNVESGDDPDSDGILGTEALGQGKMIIDMPDLKLYFRQDRAGHYGNAFEQRLRTGGLDIFPDSKKRLLVLVRPGSPAQKAGIRSGDSVVFLGKVNVQDLNPASANLSDPEVAATMAKIGLELLQKNLTITIQREDGSRIVMTLPSTDISKRGK